MSATQLPRSPITVGQAAEVLGISTRTVRRYIASGVLPAHRVGPRLLKLKLADVERFRDSNQVVATAGDGRRGA